MTKHRESLHLLESIIDGVADIKETHEAITQGWKQLELLLQAARHRAGTEDGYVGIADTVRIER